MSDTNITLQLTSWTSDLKGLFKTQENIYNPKVINCFHKKGPPQMFNSVPLYFSRPKEQPTREPVRMSSNYERTKATICRCSSKKVFRPATLLKSDSNIDVLLQILRIFKNIFFYRTPLVAAFESISLFTKTQDSGNLFCFKVTK